MQLQIVNTVNTELNNSYDFGIHAHGCQDVKRAERRYGVRVEQFDGTPAEYIADSEADFASMDMEGFSYRTFPCCK